MAIMNTGVFKIWNRCRYFKVVWVFSLFFELLSNNNYFTCIAARSWIILHVDTDCTTYMQRTIYTWSNFLSRMYPITVYDIFCEKKMKKILIYGFQFSFQFDYVPDAGSLVPTSQGISAGPVPRLQDTTFHGVHKTLEMKQSLDQSGQPTFVTNSSYFFKSSGKSCSCSNLSDF